MSLTKCEQCGRTLSSLEEIEDAVCDQCFKEFVFDEDDYRELDFHEDFYYGNG